VSYLSNSVSLDAMACSDVQEAIRILKEAMLHGVLVSCIPIPRIACLDLEFQHVCLHCIFFMLVPLIHCTTFRIVNEACAVMY
jgi:hypothetical protein